MQTSSKGIEALKLEEGDVLRAYRCPAGVWTIGPGLTAASGVVSPRAGMVISRAESDRLTRLALDRNYEPAVAAAMPGAAQHAFDAGVLFHWNTGAITRASWVPLWVQKAARPLIEVKFRQWNKGDGKVMPGLVARRGRELLILFDARYPALSGPKSASVSLARWVITLDFPEMVAALTALTALGYNVGIDPDAVPAGEVRRFQGDHGLTRDGAIGRATLSTLQRRIDAASAAKKAAVSVPTATALSVPADGGEALIDALAGVPYLSLAVLAAALGFTAWKAWAYRDAVAAKINARAPRVAAFLRSF